MSDDSTATLTAAAVAASLDGCEYPFDPPRKDQDAWESAGLWVLVGASDDLFEIYGKGGDEVGAYDGTSVGLCREGLVSPPDVSDLELDGSDIDDSEEALSKLATWGRRRRAAIEIEALWCPPGESLSWRIQAPEGIGTPFNVMEDGEVFCRGVVISADELPDMAAL